jgi:uncharacterized membrane protein YraQ (UPF0718 family)
MEKKLFSPSMIFVILLTLAGAIKVYSGSGFAGVWHIFTEDVWLFSTIVIKVMLGCIIAAFLFLLLPKEVISRFIGAESGLKGLILATIIGMIFPSGPFNIYPIAIALLAAGAGIGAVMSFITAWALIGLNRAIVWELPFLGSDFVILRHLMSLPAPIIVGLTAQFLSRWIKPKW